jgi:transposase
LGGLFRQLDYKTRWYGAQLVKADRWFPSSKLCSGCGVVKAKLHLAERTYQCDSCRLVIDRDLNAAVNLARYTQRTRVPGSSRAEPTVSRHLTVMLVAEKPEPEPK